MSIEFSLQARAQAAEHLISITDWVRWGASRLAEAKVVLAHGHDNVVDESMALVLHALSLGSHPPAEFWQAKVDSAEREAIIALFVERIEARRPVAYLTGRAWFAGLEFLVNEDVLVPRSPFAELIERNFAPWLMADPDDAGRIADIGTGSGCIAIACALAFPGAQIDAVDISAEALAVAEANVHDYGLEERVRLLRGSLLEPLQGRYELIVSNPPYVDGAAMRALSAEHAHEPALGLAAGEDGLDCVRGILAQAADHLQVDGLLVVEVGDSRPAFEAAFPDLPAAWPEFERGAQGGIFAIAARDL